MGHFLARPLKEKLALGFKVSLQRSCAEEGAEKRFRMAGNIKINQRQVDFGKPKCAALQPSVEFDLRPMELPVVVRHRCKLAFKRLHFFELVFVRVVAVSPAAYHQFFVLAAQAELGLVALCAARSHQRMAHNSLL